MSAARRARAALGVAALAVTLAASVAAARPGGGESFSGGGGHGGGDGGDLLVLFELVYWLLRLTIHYPAVGLPLLGGVAVWVAISAIRQRQNRDWDSGPPAALHRGVSLDPLRRQDRDFSQVLFEDFVFRLFATAHRARGSEASLAAVAPYVSAVARASLLARGAAPVTSVVVGALRVIGLEIPPPALAGAAPASPDEDARLAALGAAPRVRITVELEANVSTAEATSYVVERWRLGRAPGVASRPPRPGQGFPCPNCGAPWQASATGTQRCASCGEVVDNGRFDWVVETILLVSGDARPPTLTTTVAERGTDLPTYRDPHVDRAWAALRQDDPQVDEDALLARLGLIYQRLNEAWSKNDLPPVRGLVSDGLYDYLQYWIDAYRAQGLRNELVDMAITKALVARVVRDRWYAAVTIRLWARGKDFVLDGNGKVVKGSRSIARAYSEYWTLIRSRGRLGAPNAQPTCSNCGAPLQVSMAGACEFCGAHVTAGEFDWVLSKIEQDDTYRG